MVNLLMSYIWKIWLKKNLFTEAVIKGEDFIFTEIKVKLVYIIDVKEYGGHGGYFIEKYKEEDFFDVGLENKFV